MSKQGSSSAAVRALQKELRDLSKEPLEGFTVEPQPKVGAFELHIPPSHPPSPSSPAGLQDMFKWQVGIYGPPKTIYEGGYFKAELSFPADYPISPPTMRFLSPMYHPNVYQDGRVCISILHPPGNDHMSGERPEERWLPSQSVRTVLLSVISMLNEPNTSSPANVDASVAYRKWKEEGLKDYKTRVKELVKKSREQADREGIRVPNTVDDYCVKPKLPAEDYNWEEDDYGEALSTGTDEDDSDEEDGGDS